MLVGKRSTVLSSLFSGEQNFGINLVIVNCYINQWFNPLSVFLIIFNTSPLNFDKKTSKNQIRCFKERKVESDWMKPHSFRGLIE